MGETTRTLAERYELGPTIGEGGMGRVHRGFDHALGRPVAVKVLTPPNDRDGAFVERFRREARSAARVSHPNVVAVFDTGSDGGTEFIVTELVEGETLRDMVRRDGPLAPARAVEIARGICRGLDAAHSLGVVHRDIKPENVMLTDGGVKVLDFGIARAAEGGSLTRTDSLLGTAPYLSPEQAAGASGDERSDLYSLGCVLFEMLTGRPPFVGATQVAVLYQHVNEPPPSLLEVASVPTRLERLVGRLLAKEPADRFASALEVERALRDALHDDDTVPLRPLDSASSGSETLPLPRPLLSDEVGPIADANGARRSPLVMAGLVLVLLVGAIAFMASGVRDERAGASEVADVYDDLVRSIATARAAGAVTDAAAAELEQHASTILRTYRAGDAKAVASGIDRFAQALARMTETGGVSSGAAATIVGAFERFIAALDAMPPSRTTPTVSPSGATLVPEIDEAGDEEQPGGDGERGPPPHANAGGNGKGND